MATTQVRLGTIFKRSLFIETIPDFLSVDGLLLDLPAVEPLEWLDGSV